MDDQNLSPLPVKNSLVTYTFYDVLRELTNGRKATRLEWHTNDIYILIRNSFLEIYQNGKFESLIVSEGDINAIDWVLLPESS